MTNKPVALVYTPAACAAATLSVAPTKTSWVPPVSVPFGVGVLVKVPTVILFDPLVSVIGAVGSEIEKADPVKPVTVNFAAVTVPVVTGSVTPPPAVRALAGLRATVPAMVGLTATLPKFRSTDLEMAIGVIIVAEEVAVAVTCAFKVTDVSVKRATSEIRMESFFIVFKFFFELLLVGFKLF